MSIHNKTRILNFAGIGSGGGLQNSLSFLDTLAGDEEIKQKCIALVRRGRELHQLCQHRNIRHESFSYKPFSRMTFELGHRKRFSRGQTCFSIFGPVPLRSEGYLLNVNGCAYSNLFYPEIAFWSWHTPVSRAIREFVDIGRKRWTAKADYWIFETAALKKRAIELCGFPESRVAVVRMAPSSLVSPEKVDSQVSDEYNRRMPKAFRFLFLSGAQPNKRIAFLPEIAQELINRGFRDFVFVTTMPDNHEYSEMVSKKFQSFGVDSHRCNLGPVAPSSVASLIHCVDAICTFSRLESFSNNFIEAWRMKKALVATDADWARDSCGSAALYINPEDAATASEQLSGLMDSSTMRQTLVADGVKQLATYPTPTEKMRQYFQCMEEAERMGPCPGQEKRRIHWPKQISQDG